MSAIPGWTVTGGSISIDWHDSECDTDPPLDGSRYLLDIQRSLRASCSNNGGVIQVTNVPEVGQYLLVPDLRSTDDPNKSAIVSIDGIETEIFGSATKATWETHAIPFTASMTNVQIHIDSPDDHPGFRGPKLDNVRGFDGDCNNDGIPDLEQIEQGILDDTDGSFVPDICEAACVGDLSQDGTVDAADLGALIAQWNTDGSVVPGLDLNEDGVADSADLSLLISVWGACY